MRTVEWKSSTGYRNGYGYPDNVVVISILIISLI